MISSVLNCCSYVGSLSLQVRNQLTIPLAFLICTYCKKDLKKGKSDFYLNAIAVVSIHSIIYSMPIQLVASKVNFLFPYFNQARLVADVIASIVIFPAIVCGINKTIQMLKNEGIGKNIKKLLLLDVSFSILFFNPTTVSLLSNLGSRVISVIR